MNLILTNNEIPCQGLNLNCIVIHELFVITELTNYELLGIHTPDLPHLLL